MDLTLGKGIFLIAAPSLRDPNFRQTVVLLCEYGPEGALGVVVNRPTAMSISEALPQVPIIEGAGHVLYAGGPVQTNQVMLLYRGREFPENAHHVFDGVCLGGDMGMVERLPRVSGIFGMGARSIGKRDENRLLDCSACRPQLTLRKGSVLGLA